MIFGLDESKQRLIEMGERCLKLADDLGHGGRRLSKPENDLLKAAYLPVLMEHLSMIKVGYVTNDIEMIDRASEVIHDCVITTQYKPPTNKK